MKITDLKADVLKCALAEPFAFSHPLDIEGRRHCLHHATRDHGRKGSVVSGISAIDGALPDVAGQFHGLPIHKLTGGAFRTRAQACATGFYRLAGQGEAARLGEEALRHLEAGFSPMKAKPGYGVEDDIACMNAIGTALQGKPARLMVDTGHGGGREEALRLGRPITTPIQHVGGRVDIPSGPGLGMKVDRAVVEEFRIGR